MTEKPKPEKPVCPYCKTEMWPVRYVGYYDEFCCWSCNCHDLPDAKKERGQHV